MPYFSKLLLFGEQSILVGSDALAMPLVLFQGEWKITSASDKSSKQGSLDQFSNYLEEKLSDVLYVQKFKEELEEGLYFESNIPIGYGAGSSGALVAAVFDRFKKREESSLKELQATLAKMESYFHGSSSGIDPLICYLRKAVFLKGKESLEIVSLPNFSNLSPYSIFLLDSGLPRKSGDYINIFLEKCKEESYLRNLQEIFFPTNNGAIADFLNGKWDELFEGWQKISNFQLEQFSELIPPVFKSAWKVGLENESYYLKLCGAGGGGFILGMTKDFDKTKEDLSDYQLYKVY